MAKVCLDNLSKAFGKELAVHRLNLDVNDGEFLVLLGPSGCGKSTTLNMIAGLEKQDSGSIMIDNMTVDDVAPNLRNISMVFQSISLYPHLNVYDNIAFPLKLAKNDSKLIEKKVNEVSLLLQIGELLHRKPYELSGGQRQRVALGRAVVRNPKVFLFDEPLSSLDAKLKNEMRGEIKKLQKQLGATFIYVTHDQIEAMTLADKIVVMDKGTIQQIGTPNDIYKDPKNTMIAGFLGNPSMNLVEIKMVDDENKGEFQASGNNFNFKLSKNLKIPSKLAENVKFIGVRPEKVLVGDKPPFHDSFFSEGFISLIEPVGSDSYIDIQVNPPNQNHGNVQIKARIEPTRNLTVSEKLFISWHFKDTYFFDKEGQRVF